MNQDIRIATSWRSHRKKKKLIKLLGPQGVVSWLDLLLAVAENRPEGRLTNMSIEDIALDAEWPGDPDSFVKVLVEVRLLDYTDGLYSIHDWKEHNPYCFYAKDRSEKARKAAQARWGKEKGMLKNATGMLRARFSNAPSPSPIPSPNSLFPKGNKQPSAASSSKHFSDNINQEFLPPLLEIALQLKGKGNGKKPFNAYKWIQQHTKKGSHPGAMIKALQALLDYWPTVNNPEAYLSGIMKVEHQNFNEADHNHEVEILKTEIAAWVQTPQGRKISQLLNLKKIQ